MWLQLMTGTTPAASAASAESNPKMSKKQGIRILVVSVNHCVHIELQLYSSCYCEIICTITHQLTIFLSLCLRFTGRKRKIPTEKVATGQKNGSEKPPKKRQKKEGTCTCIKPLLNIALLYQVY